MIARRFTKRDTNMRNKRTHRYEIVHGLFDAEFRKRHLDAARSPFAGRHDVLQDVGVKPFGQHADASLLVERRQDYEQTDVATLVRQFQHVRSQFVRTYCTNGIIIN